MKDQVLRLDVSEVEIRDHLHRTKLNIDNLAESILTTGQISPIVVKKKGTKYQVIAGRRRFTAIRIPIQAFKSLVFFLMGGSPKQVSCVIERYHGRMPRPKI